MLRGEKETTATQKRRGQHQKKVTRRGKAVWGFPGGGKKANVSGTGTMHWGRRQLPGRQVTKMGEVKIEEKKKVRNGEKRRGTQ